MVVASTTGMGRLLNVLVINSGSSSVKFELISTDPEVSLLEGEIQRIGDDSASMWVETAGGSASGQRRERPVAARDHDQAMRVVMAELDDAGSSSAGRYPDAVGHRVVHGGARFEGPALIDDTVVEDIRDTARLAPLHASANLAGIDAARRCLPDVPHVAVFDTSFHRTLPPHAQTYALPREMARAHGIRRYGFHGTSHEYVSRRAAVFLRRPPESLDMITLHLGNGASATAIRGGRSIETSMGMTPLEGLVMGTRCGDLDPAVPMLLAELTGRSRVDVNRLLNNESGLLGMCGAGDMRDVHRLVAEGDRDAALALDTFCYRIKKYIGAYLAILGRLDALVFTGGIGENDAEVRRRSCAGLEGLGIAIDESHNAADANGERAINGEGSKAAVLVIPTDEEKEIARLTIAVVTARESEERGVRA